MALIVKNLAASAGDESNTGSIPGSGRASGEGNGNPLQYSYLENPRDREAWWATVHRVSKSRAQLSMHISTHKWVKNVMYILSFNPHNNF